MCADNQQGIHHSYAEKCSLLRFDAKISLSSLPGFGKFCPQEGQARRHPLHPIFTEL